MAEKLSSPGYKRSGRVIKEKILVLFTFDSKICMLGSSIKKYDVILPFSDFIF